MRHGLRIPAPGSPPRPSWHRQLVEGVQSGTPVSSRDFRVSQGAGGLVLRQRRPQARRANVAANPVALAQSSDGAVVSLTAGLLLMRGAIITVNAQTITLSSGANYLWLQFSIDPAVTVTPTLTKGTAWPTLNLGTLGYWPLSAWTVTDGVAVLTTLHHPGGNIPYPVD